IMEVELPNSGAYLQGWIDSLKIQQRKGWIIRAASHAQKAADFILNIPAEAANGGATSITKTIDVESEKIEF
ncbi:MAG: hypothetical protein WCF18_13280, partial [Chthoniobacteraceae bacterium]